MSMIFCTYCKTAKETYSDTGLVQTHKDQDGFKNCDGSLKAVSELPELVLKICPNPKCMRENVRVVEGVIASHYFGPKGSLTPKEPCRLSKELFTNISNIPAEEFSDRINWRQINPSRYEGRI